MKEYVFILIILATTLSAKVLTMQACIDKALDTHPDIKSFILDVSKSEQNTISVRSAYLPHINLQAEYDVQHTYVLPQNGQFSTIENDGWQAGVVAEQKIWDFGQTTSKMQSAELENEISQLSVEEAQKIMVYKVESLYISVLVQKEAVKVHQQDMQTKKELYEQALAFVEQGLKTTSDATRFLSSYYVAKDALGVAESSYEKALSSLSLYTAEQITSHTEFEDDLIQKRETSDISLAQLKHALLSNNTQLKIYDKTITKNQLQYKGAKAAHYGSIDAVASYTHFDTLNAYDASLVGVTLNIPIYSGSDISAQTQMASITTSLAKNSKDSKLLALNEELSALVIDLKQYENTIEAKQAQLKSSLSTKELLDARYKEGLATYIEVLDATALYLSAELGLLEAYFSRMMVQNRLKYLTGIQL